MSEVLPELKLESGITVTQKARVALDWNAIKALVESGVPAKDVAKHFKISHTLVSFRSKKEGWLSPVKVEGMRRAIVEKQRKFFKETGKAADINELKVEIWKERSDAMKEKTFRIVEKALEGVTDEHAARMIKNPLGLMHMTTVARLITGDEAEEAKAPRMAVNIGFLRSVRPEDVEIEAQIVD
jgi:hypothetical protein